MLKQSSSSQRSSSLLLLTAAAAVIVVISFTTSFASSSNNNIKVLTTNSIIIGTPKHGYFQSGEPQFWFHQRIDHFDSLNTKTFPQRYYKFVPEGVSPSSSNHLLYICPEAACGGTPNNYVRNYAKELKATIYTLEHRFYGLSGMFIVIMLLIL